MKQFKREDGYLALKISDCNMHLTDNEIADLVTTLANIAKAYGNDDSIGQRISNELTPKLKRDMVERQALAIKQPEPASAWDIEESALAIYRIFKSTASFSAKDGALRSELKSVFHAGINQPAQPEPVATVLRSDFDFVMQEKQRCVKLVEETYNLLAESKPLEAKDLLQKRVNNEYVNIPVFIAPTSTEGK